MQSRGSKHAKSIRSKGDCWFDSYSNEENLLLEYTFFFNTPKWVDYTRRSSDEMYYTRDFPLPEKAILLDFSRYTSINFGLLYLGY